MTKLAFWEGFLLTSITYWVGFYMGRRNRRRNKIQFDCEACLGTGVTGPDQTCQACNGRGIRNE